MRLALISLLMIPLAVGCGDRGDRKSTQVPKALPPPISTSDIRGSDTTTTGPAVELDEFLGGIENGCSRNEVLDKALFSVLPSSAYGESIAQISTMIAPEYLKRTFGKPKLTVDEDNYSAFTVPIHNATYLGFPATSLTGWQGKENGINGFSITLTGSPAAVATKARSTLNVRRDEDGFGFIMTFDGVIGETSISCDTSM